MHLQSRLRVGWFAKTATVVLVVVGAVAALRLLTHMEQTVHTRQEIERDLRIRTGGGAGEDDYDVVQALMAEGVGREAAVDAAATLSYIDASALDGLGTARLLARFEQGAPAAARPSRDLVRVAEQLGVDGGGLWSFLDFAARESTQRRMPVEPLVAGLSEHGFEYAEGCEIVEQAPCPADAVVRLALDRQQSDYEQWGHVDCNLGRNDAHPGCLTFVDCADEYALALVAQDADLDAFKMAMALGHEPGSPDWHAWTDTAHDTARSSWQAHADCVAARYGEGMEAYKALVTAG